jgi:hypothetical protein
MSRVVELFEMGGWPTYVVVLLGLVALAGAFGAIVIAATATTRGAAVAIAASALVLSLAPIAMGFVGYRIGLGLTEAAIAYADPESRDALRARGEEESFANIIVGGACTAFPFGLALAAIGVAVGKRRAATR